MRSGRLSECGRYGTPMTTRVDFFAKKAKKSVP
ncbi:hypothetical protein CBM2586_A60104 [Cupriavidus phytorum]|uniref:Uncharacterized protein n=1 Tax=Cupriavidus taiwanensis TaxID=164546 RepID=A0A375BME4_9BURK|nr:hypothetical protein CBM2589_B200229 [Cupriavidus taiwanensis]SOY63816.1 hypothetical protein CBM2586_A60104 [Cupriavidus taiwanensis]SOY82173.1 hypothetical protein CBM2600_A120791 [Cupriavidus taiwanensis]SOY82534.1 hypothetical protein CBM2599_A140102 [Cupriavidus taiwanensis]SPA26238.1 hypothetical protein CBM2637_A200028 [Cupriavidus taiwanensis]